MLIKELHPDIERYLLHDCYCPHEIYSFDGFGYELFYEDQECEKIGEHISTDPEHEYSFVACMAKAFNKEDGEVQVVVFSYENDKVVDAIRYDATENNLNITKDIMENGINGRKFKFDEYVPGSTAKSIAQMMALCNGIVIRD